VAPSAMNFATRIPGVLIPAAQAMSTQPPKVAGPCQVFLSMVCQMIVRMDWVRPRNGSFRYVSQRSSRVCLEDWLAQVAVGELAVRSLEQQVSSRRLGWQQTIAMQAKMTWSVKESFSVM
jgi:hypothetical protein